MRIAIVSAHTDPLGGADTDGQVAGLAVALAELGHAVTVYTRRTGADQDTPALLAPGAVVEYVPAGPPEPLTKDALPPYMPAFAAWLARRWTLDRPDVAHAHHWMSGTAALNAATWLAVPVVQTFHTLGTVERRWQGTVSDERIAAERDIGRRAIAIIATCTDEVRELAAMGVPTERITVVPYGVDLGRFSPDGPAARPADQDGRPLTAQVLSVGRLIPREGVDTIIEALPRVPEARLIVAGGRPGDAEWLRLRALASASGLAARVRLIGGVGHAEMPALVRSAQVVVSVPWYEPFGMVPVEAMACGIPVVASAVGGHLDTVPGCGILVPPRRPLPLAKALRDLLAHPGLRASLAAAGLRRARSRYGRPWVAARTESVYREAIGERADRLATAEG
ncbi:glycosyltransferase [Sphaerisporangium aureirubrum]|uniref:Glycosyltransferase n=1 Tax=Sphaerisporangium aureirubrum TaxID=1544736 RepID=A0ABW1NAL3_9ACTN